MTEIIERITEDSGTGETAPTPDELAPYVTPLPVPAVVRPGADGMTKTYRRTSRTFNDGFGFTIAEGSYEQWSFVNYPGAKAPGLHNGHHWV